MDCFGFFVRDFTHKTVLDVGSAHGSFEKSAEFGLAARALRGADRVIPIDLTTKSPQTPIAYPLPTSPSTTSSRITLSSTYTTRQSLWRR